MLYIKVYSAQQSPLAGSCQGTPKENKCTSMHFLSIPCLSPLLLTLTQGVRTELVLDARNCEWKGCRESFTHNKMLNLTKLIDLKQKDESHKEEFQWIQRHHVAFLCAEPSQSVLRLDLTPSINLLSVSAIVSTK